MAAIELYNHTHYNNEIITDACKTAKRLLGVQGDVAVKVTYQTKAIPGKPFYIGWARQSVPSFSRLAGRAINKFAHKKYTHVTSSGFKRFYATKDAKPGWIEIKLPRNGHRYPSGAAIDCWHIIRHELGHIWQFRNMSITAEFSGYGRGRVRRQNHQDRPIEHHVDKISKECIEKSPYAKKRSAEIVDSLEAMFANAEEGYKQRQEKKKANKPKYNKYGQKISDYRNVKMNKLRSGEEVVRCPCGEKAVILDIHKYDVDKTYTHIASVDQYTVRWSGYSAAECRETQFGHIVNNDTNEIVSTVQWGHGTNGPVDEDVFKSFNENFYRG